MSQPFVATLLALVVLASACSRTRDADADSAAVAVTPASATADSSTAGDRSGNGAVVKTATDAKIGPYLTDATGRALYLFEKDQNGQSACEGDCAAAWPPYLSPGTPMAADSGVTVALLTVVQRPDGNRQVAYNGMPLYYYSKDTGPGDTKGQDIKAFGADWYLVAPDGTKLEGKEH